MCEVSDELWEGDLNSVSQGQVLGCGDGGGGAPAGGGQWGMKGPDYKGLCLSHEGSPPGVGDIVVYVMNYNCSQKKHNVCRGAII